MFGHGNSAGGGHEGRRGADVERFELIATGATGVEQALTLRGNALGPLAHRARRTDDFRQRFTLHTQRRQKEQMWIQLPSFDAPGGPPTDWFQVLRDAL